MSLQFNRCHIAHRLMQRCSLNNAWTMLLSRFNNTCWIDNVDEYCSINSCSMLTKNNGCYNVIGTRADNSWWKKLVDRCQQWLINDCWTWTTLTVNNGCWQQLLTGCSTTLLTGCSTHVFKRLKALFFFCKSERIISGGWILSALEHSQVSLPIFERPCVAANQPAGRTNGTE